MRADKTKWEKTILSEITHITMGQSPDSSSYNKDSLGIPFFQGNADFGKIHPTPRIYCNAPTRTAKKNDILISVRAPIGAINIANAYCCIGRGLAAIQVIAEKSYLHFIKYVLKAANEELNRQGTGMTFKAINKKVLYNLPIQLPTFDIQQSIAAELDAIQFAIDGYKEQLGDLDALAESIFLDTFGDVVNNDREWDFTSFENMTSSINYGTSLPAVEGGKYKYLRMGNITDNGYLDLQDLKYIDIPEGQIDKFIVCKGDILFNRTNSREKVGKTACFMEDESMVIAGYIIRVRIDETKALPLYVARAFNTPKMKQYLRKLARGSVGQANINSKELANIKISLPPLPLQQQFATQVEAIERQKELIRLQLADAETLMAERMQYYFS